MLDRNAPLIQRLARVEAIDHMPVGKGAVTLSVPGAVMALPLADIVDVDAEKKRLDKAMQKVAKDIGGLKGKLGNEKFLANAKPEVVEEQRERLAAAEVEAEKQAFVERRKTSLFLFGLLYLSIAACLSLAFI